jgi:hypothetical protein
VLENVELYSHIGAREVDRLDLESAPSEGLAGWVNEDVVNVAYIATACSLKESNLPQNQGRARAQHNFSHPPEDLSVLQKAVRARRPERSGWRYHGRTARGDLRVLTEGTGAALLGAIDALAGHRSRIEGVATRPERTLDGGRFSCGLLGKGLAFISGQAGEQKAEPLADAVAAAYLC